MWFHPTDQRNQYPLITFTASMELFSLHLNFHAPIHHLVLFSVHLFSALFLSLAYDIPDKYFVNCGSSRDLSDAGRRFAGDSNSNVLFFPEKESIAVEDHGASANDSSLYSSARVFVEPSAYEFQIDSPGMYYLVRLHFYPFSSAVDLSTALFGVSASGHYLLRNFGAGNHSSYPIIEEFFLRITSETLQIYFLPNNSSIAFVNAMEVFLVPPNLIPDSADLIGPSGSKTPSTKMSSLIFHTLYRINVGNLAINSSDDKLWRKWDLDDDYLLNRTVARNTDVYRNRPRYSNDEGEYIAPPLVYRTAKEMNTGADESTTGLITWSFSVRKNARHFVRAHFCDIIGPSVGAIVFNLSIDRNFSEKIKPLVLTNDVAVPFHIDFLVDSDSSGTVNISVGTVNNTDVKNAYLNGLEIMESLEIPASVPLIIDDNRKKKINLPVVIGAVAGGFVFLCVFGAVIWLSLKWMKPTVVENSEWTLVSIHKGGSSHSKVTEATTNGSALPNLNLGLTISFGEILTATKNFHIKLLIGKGGFGYVYQGILRSGTKVAVKRCHPGSSQGLPEFEREVLVLSKIRHKNLVSLVGYCDERSEMILVYEFMENGTLKEHLYGSQLPPLSWKQRLEICIGAAKGLHYLHKGSAGGIIHRDVKSTNILLDENLSAKVADFGLSRVGPVDGTHVSTAVKGTFGYLDPEYFRTQQLTEKSDVYSFGVVLFEVLCARPAINPLMPRDQMNLAELGIRSTQQGSLDQIIDPSLKGQINPSSLRKFSETAAKCLRDDGDERPSMSDVLWDLEYSLKLQQTAVIGEPYDDSTVDATADLHRFPSGNSRISEEE